MSGFETMDTSPRQSLLERFAIEHNLDDEGMRRLLSDKLRRPISLRGYQQTKVKDDHNLPHSWLRALELPIPTRPPAKAGEPAAPDTGGLRDDDRAETLGSPPSPPPPGAVALVVDWGTAREMLVAIHLYIGKGVAKLRKDPELEQIFTRKGISGQNACEMLADDWIAVARVNPRVAAMLARLTSGGPAAKLATDYMMIAFAIMTRKRPDGSVDLPGPETIADGPREGFRTVRPVA